MSEKIEKLAKYMNVSDKQVEFLRLYEETLDLKGSAEAVGLKPANVMRSLKNNTPFAKLFQQLAIELDKDPRFNRTGAIGMLMELKERAKEADKLELEFKILQEINKMIDGNIAATKKTINKVNYDVKGVIDLTKPFNEPKTIDIQHSEVDNG